MRDFLRAPDGGGGTSRLDFAAFVKAYAWIFYRGGDRYSSQDDTGESSGDVATDLAKGGKEHDVRHRTGRDQSQDRTSNRKLGYGSRGSREKVGRDGRGRRRERSRGVGIGIGEEAELRRWEKRLGAKQLRRLQQVFDMWAEDTDGDGEGGGVIEARDLGECFRELGKDFERRELRAWCDEVDLNPEDTLSMADFAFAFHAMFVDSGEGVTDRVILGHVLLCIRFASPSKRHFERVAHIMIIVLSTWLLPGL